MLSSSPIYIPPPGLRFLIQSYATDWVIFLADSTPMHTFPLQQILDKKDSEAWCTLLHGSGKHKGRYAIKSPALDKVLFSRKGPEPCVGIVGGDGRWDDNWFEFESGSGQYAKHFRLITPSESSALRTPTPYIGMDLPWLGNTSSSTFNPNQLFGFVWEDMKVDRVEFNLDSGRIISSTPIVLAEQVLTNKSDTEQEMSFSVNKSVTNSSTFEYSTGFTVTVGMEFSVGVPIISEAKFKVEASTTNTWTWGKSTSYTTQYTATFPVKAAPHKAYRAMSVANQGTLDVPYTMHLSSKSTGVKVQTSGTWQGVSSWDIRHTIMPADPET